MAARTCYACNELIEGDMLFAFNLYWHPNHLTCKVCGKDFSDGSKVEEGSDGMAYCTADYDTVFRPKCGGCGEPVLESEARVEAMEKCGGCGEPVLESEARVEAMEKIWHPAHFKCPSCKNPLADNIFYPADDGMPYCERHFYERKGLLCCVCERPINSGKRIRVGEQSYHTEHFCCTYCKKNLLGMSYKEKSAKPYCLKCFTQLFG
ncbi:eIF-2-alpha kinase activator GCN1 [Pelomyxa schiedti]|nr:eIF-2-alpha kinase activator GCN1 [Pelomyxa schiedti]